MIHVGVSKLVKINYKGTKNMQYEIQKLKLVPVGWLTLTLMDTGEIHLMTHSCIQTKRKAAKQLHFLFDGFP